MALIILVDLNIITEEEHEKFHLKTTKYADILEEEFKMADPKFHDLNFSHFSFSAHSENNDHAYLNPKRNKSSSFFAQ